jgi:hypothetical protein
MLKIRKSLIFVVVIFLSTIFLAPSGNASAIPKSLAAYKNQLCGALQESFQDQ